MTRQFYHLKTRFINFNSNAATIVLLATLITNAFSQDSIATDRISGPLRPYTYQKEGRDNDIQVESYYVEMRDGVKIAVDLYLPKDLETSDKLPCILFQTRYWRSIKFRWPASVFLNELDHNGAGKSYIKKFIENGYAFVSVDVRGSGASTGIWKHPFHKAEILDANEIVDWIINRAWSNGKIGLFGRSYSGSAAEFSLVNDHPAIKASMPMYTPFDVFDDIGFPGGVHNTWYTTTWGKTNTLLDQNKVPIDDWKAKLAVTGVSPVKGHKKTLQQAIADHSKNIQIDQVAGAIDFRNDIVNDSLISLDVFSPYRHIKKINKSNVPIYSYSGWMDGGYQHAAIKRYLNLTVKHKKLIIGPWDHMGRNNISPTKSGKSAFDHFSEVLKFFDYHLKNIDNGIDRESPIHFFTMGEGKWKGTHVWPPKYVSDVRFYLNGGGKLSRHPNRQHSEFSVHIDTTFGAGHSTRWEAAAGPAPLPPLYEGSFIDDSKGSIVFSSAPLKLDVELTGHPIVNLDVVTKSTDLSVSVYLEVIDKNGKSHHITEGHFRAIHRKIAVESLYKDIVPQHSYLSTDQMPMIPNERATLIFDLLPTSFLFKRGQRIQVRVTSGDNNHFKNYNTGVKYFKLLSGGNYSSTITLPILEKR